MDDEEEARQEEEVVMFHPEEERPPQQPPPPVVDQADVDGSSASPIKEGGYTIISNRKNCVLLAMVMTLGIIVLAVGLGVGLSSTATATVEQTTTICHFPSDKTPNFSTLDISQNDVAAHLEHGDLMGSCQENCLDICLGGQDGLLWRDNVPTRTIPVRECVERCRPDWSTGVAVVVVSDGGSNNNTPSELLDVVSCDNSTVVIQGLDANDIAPGLFLIKLASDDDMVRERECSPCNPLFRVVKSVSTNGTAGIMIMSTTFASLGDIFGKKAVVNPLLRDQAVELMAPGCPPQSSSTIDGGRLLVADADQAAHHHHRQLQQQSFPNNCTKWSTIDKDTGQCLYTNCVVDKSANPDLCFECGNACDNGCGPTGLSFDGTFGTFDFGEACCNHDYCWTSTSVFSREECDLKFLEDMRAQCRASSSSRSALAGRRSQFFFLPFKAAAAPVPATASTTSDSGIAAAATCEALALSFYSMVSSDWPATDIFLKSRATQEAYEAHCGAEQKDSTEPATAPLQNQSQLLF